MPGVNEPAMADPWAPLPNSQGYHSEVLPAQPRTLTVQKEKSQAISNTAATAEPTPKRKVSSNACEPCRKRKSKCDGGKPFCAGCATTPYATCVYDLDKDLRRKGALRQEIQRLKKICEDHQFVIDSLCVAEEPHLSQLIQCIRSLHSIEAIAASWHTGDFAHLDPLQAAPLPTLGEVNEGHNFGDSGGGPPFLEMAANQTNININQSSVLTNQASIKISGSNVQINRPGMDVPMPGVSNIAGIPEMPVVLGVPGVPVQPGQLGVPLNQSMNVNVNGNTKAFTTSAVEYQRAPPNLGGWYDEWGRPWHAYD